MKYLSLSSDEKNRPRTYANGYLIADKAAYAAAEKVFRKPAEPKPPKRIKTRTIVLLILWSALVVGLIVLGTVGKFNLPLIIAMLVMFFSLSVVTTLLLTLSSRRPKAVEESEKQWIKYVDHRLFLFCPHFSTWKNVEIHHVDKSKCGKECRDEMFSFLR